MDRTYSFSLPRHSPRSRVKRVSQTHFPTPFPFFFSFFEKFPAKKVADSVFFCTFATDFKSIATMAQLVEQRIRNAWVGGSSPPGGSEKASEEFFWELLGCFFSS